jgi:hypothetical protein
MLIYFAYMYENRTIKPDEIVLRSRGERMRENGRRVTLIKIHCKYTCKCGNELPAPLYN